MIIITSGSATTVSMSVSVLTNGFANNYEYVLPLMIKYQVPVSFLSRGIREAGYAFLWNDFLSMLQKYGPGEVIIRKRNVHKTGTGCTCQPQAGRR